MRTGKRLRLALISAFFAPLLAFAGEVNVNIADAETIAAELKGIGLSKARAIVEYREKHGAFRSVDDLTQVKGIGTRTVEANRKFILLKDNDASQ
jgi:competence protein ComEA